MHGRFVDWTHSFQSWNVVVVAVVAAAAAAVTQIYGLPTGQMSRLQSVLHAAARLVLGLPGRAPVSAAMHDTLHWLSFPQRVTFELCLLKYKTSARSGTRLPVALQHVTDLRSWPSSVTFS